MGLPTEGVSAADLEARGVELRHAIARAEHELEQARRAEHDVAEQLRAIAKRGEATVLTTNHALRRMRRETIKTIALAIMTTIAIASTTLLVVSRSAEKTRNPPAPTVAQAPPPPAVTALQVVPEPPPTAEVAPAPEAPKAVFVPRAPVRRTSVEPAELANPSGLGAITIVCMPKCDATLDNGVSLGPGDIFNRPMSVGRHTLTLMRGTVTKTVPVQIFPETTREVRMSMDSMSLDPPMVRY